MTTLLLTIAALDVIITLAVIPCLECSKYKRQCRNAKVIREAIYRAAGKEEN